MKIYTLTIGINENSEEVEFIKEEQYNLNNDNPVPFPEEDIKQKLEKDNNKLLESILKLSFNIIGEA